MSSRESSIWVINCAVVLLLGLFGAALDWLAVSGIFAAGLVEAKVLVASDDTLVSVAEANPLKVVDTLALAVVDDSLAQANPLKVEDSQDSNIKEVLSLKASATNCTNQT